MADGKGWLGASGYLWQCFILEIPVNTDVRWHWGLLHVHYVVGSHLHAARVPRLSPSSRQKAACMPWSQAGFLSCLLLGASWSVPYTHGPRGIRWPEHLQYGPIFPSTRVPSRRAASSPGGEGAGLIEELQVWGQAGSGRVRLSLLYRVAQGLVGTAAGPSTPSQHPTTIGAPCKVPSWPRALFSSGDTGKNSRSPAQRFPLPPGTTTASQPVVTGKQY